MFFEQDNQYFLINDIYFDGDVVICKKTDFVELKEWLKNIMKSD